jgi:hypothetical protein
MEHSANCASVTPHHRDSSDPQHDDLQFPDQVRQIKTMLNSVLGSHDPVSAIHIPYEDRGEDEDFEFAHGKILIQYDPVQEYQQTADQSCATQMAALEVWYEEVFPDPRYRDMWSAFPNQVVAVQPGPTKRLIRDLQATHASEEELQEYLSVLRRQNAICVRPSGTLSTSPTARGPTTMQTSVVTTSDSAQSRDVNSTTHPTPSSTPKSRALSIAVRALQHTPEFDNQWVFYETEVGVPADICAPNATLYDNKSRWRDTNAVHVPPWPHGTFTMTLHGEDNCQYSNDGTDEGILHCPSFGDGNNVSCNEDAEKSLFSAYTPCPSEGISVAAHRVVYCEW